MLIYLEKAGLVKGVTEEIEEAISVIKKVAKQNNPEVPIHDNFTKNTAYFLRESIPVIYGWGPFCGIAQRLKQQFNENSKSPAISEYFPELNHNEIVGWSGKAEKCKSFSLIFIRDIDSEPEEIKCRINTTKSIVKSTGMFTFELKVQGKSLLAKMLSAIVIGDFLSIYLAVERNLDPTAVKAVDLLKSELKANGIREGIICRLGKL